MTSVRLVTFNIHHGVGDDGRHDLARIAAVLADADPDVVCLQEVDRHYGARSEDVDQAELLARALDRELLWASAIEKARPGDRPAVRYGNALLTRLPVADEAAVRLPGSGEPRAALRADLVSGDGALRVVATHLASDSARSRA
ncbi:endonuclease/exonuclease/phosphatase family protein, partial [Klenkia sp. PcliD-1-E]|uniref:endonuclease/exonuclease/phosphatase family protein n=1 Tax=Klenkia sp. PcliD-1-E TaxID=2954492 RepID=UPI002096D161